MNDDSPKPKDPTWTVFYNTVSDGSSWVGTGMEFFDSEISARNRARSILEISSPGYSGPVCAGSRPFHPGVDSPYLGAIHRYFAKSVDERRNQGVGGGESGAETKPPSSTTVK